MRTIVFGDFECTCEHDPGAHDDGFGCTDPECPCVAMWYWDLTEDMP